MKYLPTPSQIFALLGVIAIGAKNIPAAQTAFLLAIFLRMDEPTPRI